MNETNNNGDINTIPAKKNSMAYVIAIIVILLILAVLVWIFALSDNKSVDDKLNTQNTSGLNTTQSDNINNIDASLNAIDIGDVDSNFPSVDKDINSL